MNLYEINKQIEDFEPIFDDETGLLLNADYFDDLEMKRDEKIENIVLLIKNTSNVVDGLNKEVETLQARKKTALNKITFLKSYLEKNLKGEKFETSRCKISYRKSKKVEIEDEQKFCDWALRNEPELVDVKQTVKPKRKELKEYLEDHKIDGVGIAEIKNIQIK